MNQDKCKQVVCGACQTRRYKKHSKSKVWDRVAWFSKNSAKNHTRRHLSDGELSLDTGATALQEPVSDGELAPAAVRSFFSSGSTSEHSGDDLSLDQFSHQSDIPSRHQSNSNILVQSCLRPNVAKTLFWQLDSVQSEQKPGWRALQTNTGSSHQRDAQRDVVSEMTTQKNCHCLACCRCSPKERLSGLCPVYLRRVTSTSSLDRGLSDVGVCVLCEMAGEHRACTLPKGIKSIDRGGVPVVDAGTETRNVGKIECTVAKGIKSVDRGEIPLVHPGLDTQNAGEIECTLAKGIKYMGEVPVVHMGTDTQKGERISSTGYSEKHPSPQKLSCFNFDDRDLDFYDYNSGLDECGEGSCVYVGSSGGNTQTFQENTKQNVEGSGEYILQSNTNTQTLQSNTNQSTERTGNSPETLSLQSNTNQSTERTGDSPETLSLQSNTNQSTERTSDSPETLSLQSNTNQSTERSGDGTQILQSNIYTQTLQSNANQTDDNTQTLQSNTNTQTLQSDTNQTAHCDTQSGDSGVHLLEESLAEAAQPRVTEVGQPQVTQTEVTKPKVTHPKDTQNEAAVSQFERVGQFQGSCVPKSMNTVPQNHVIQAHTERPTSPEQLTLVKRDVEESHKDRPHSALVLSLSNSNLLPRSCDPPYSPSKFKEKADDVEKWFVGLNDDQKNTLLLRLLTHSDIVQKHFLCDVLGTDSHPDCPPNCQDRIAWLPYTLVLQIFSYLDPVSLGHAAQVCRIWYNLVSEPSIWRRFCHLPKWKLSRSGEQKQIAQHKGSDGSVEWKRVFAERFHLRNNWLHGRCTVRTFEGHMQGISCVQFDDTRIVSGSSDKTIKVWNIRTNSPWSVQTLVGHSGTVRCLHLEGNRLVSGSTDRSIKVWDLSTQHSWSSIACKLTMVGHTDTVRCLQVDDEKVISGSYDQTLKLWSMRTGRCRQTLVGHEAAVLCVHFDQSKIVSGSCDKTIKVWNFEGRCIMTLTGHQDAVTCLQFDSQRIISGSLDCTLKFWDIHTGQCKNTIDWKASEGHTGVVRCLQADSWRVVSASDDRTLKVWSLETGQRLVTLRNHSDGVTCLQFNDSIIVSGSYDKTVKLWDFSSV